MLIFTWNRYCGRKLNISSRKKINKCPEIAWNTRIKISETEERQLIKGISRAHPQPQWRNRSARGTYTTVYERCRGCEFEPHLGQTLLSWVTTYQWKRKQITCSPVQTVISNNKRIKDGLYILEIRYGSMLRVIHWAHRQVSQKPQWGHDVVDCTQEIAEIFTERKGNQGTLCR